MLNLENVTDINITRHARAQIEARGISSQALADILQGGRARESRTVPGRHIIQAGADSLVVVQNGRTLVILTAIRDGIPGAALAA